MKFSDTQDNQGIIQSCESWVFGDNYGQISDNSDRLDTFTRLTNRALDNVTNKILNADARWEYDDYNYGTSDKPVGTTDYVDGQRDYQKSASHMRVLRIEAKDSNGDYRQLETIDQEDVDQALSEFEEEDGVPKFVDPNNNDFTLYPAPSSEDVDTSDDNNGLKVYFQREPSYFSSSDTTKEPGFAKTFHQLVPMWASYLYMQQNQMFEKAKGLREEIQRMERQLQDFYNQRGELDKPQLTSMYKTTNFK